MQSIADFPDDDKLMRSAEASADVLRIAFWSGLGCLTDSRYSVIRLTRLFTRAQRVTSHNVEPAYSIS